MFQSEKLTSCKKYKQFYFYRFRIWVKLTQTYHWVQSLS